MDKLLKVLNVQQVSFFIFSKILVSPFFILLRFLIFWTLCNFIFFFSLEFKPNSGSDALFCQKTHLWWLKWFAKTEIWARKTKFSASSKSYSETDFKEKFNSKQAALQKSSNSSSIEILHTNPWSEIPLNVKAHWL